uniref:Uncharacterized protein n=1 Tax=Brassica campestris TaxID=3711 RepID=A0A3P5Y5V8_BRACM|nr:unnamed protein product [Brassica rapa]
MDKKKTVAPQSSSSSSSSSFDHIFGPRVSSPPSSSTTGLFNSIFPRPSEKRMLGRQMDFASRGGHVKYQSPSERGERSNKKDKKSYHNEETEPPCNLSSSIYYGGQENYSSTTTTTKDTVSRIHIYLTHNTCVTDKTYTLYMCIIQTQTKPKKIQIELKPKFRNILIRLKYLTLKTQKIQTDQN